MTEMAIALRGQRAVRVSHLAAALVCLVGLLAPALWNGYPLLQYDTGGYLARWYEGYLVPSRSTLFGLFLHLGEGFHFWPELVLQSGCTIWVIWLALRAFGLGTGPWRLVVVVTGLSLFTAVSVLCSTLLTDIFAGLAVLSLHLLLFHCSGLSRSERLGLLSLIAFSAATHSATVAVLLAVLIAYVPASMLAGLRLSRLLPPAAAIATGATMLLAANFALSGQLVWTPGGFGIAFGRMLQDGLVKRYLDDHCPDARLKLCPYRSELPRSADEFLWSYGIFNELGRFDGLGEEMRFIVLHSVQEYPLQHIKTALVATATQLGLVATGHGINDRIWHTYGIIEHFIPGEVPTMQKARQQHSELHFDINRVHVPIAIGSMIFVLILLVNALACGRFDAPVHLAGTVTVALLANAFVCGAVSGPHDRYGARIVWIATLTAALTILRALRAPARLRNQQLSWPA